MAGPPHGSWLPKAGLLKSPNRPFGKSSQVAALLSSSRPISPSDGGRLAKPRVAVVVAVSGVIMNSDVSVSGGGCKDAPGVS